MTGRYDDEELGLTIVSYDHYMEALMASQPWSNSNVKLFVLMENTISYIPSSVDNRTYATSQMRKVLFKERMALLKNILETLRQHKVAGRYLIDEVDQVRLRLLLS